MEEQRPGVAGGVPAATTTIATLSRRVDELERTVLERIEALERRQALIVRQQFGDAAVNVALDGSGDRDEMLAWALEVFPLPDVDDGSDDPAETDGEGKVRA